MLCHANLVIVHFCSTFLYSNIEGKNSARFACFLIDKLLLILRFQACTGIEDVGIAIAHLEEANWALVVS